jgi:hypothetical protein
MLGARQPVRTRVGGCVGAAAPSFTLQSRLGECTPDRFSRSMDQMLGTARSLSTAGLRGMGQTEGLRAERSRSVCASYQGSRRVAHACQTTMGWKRSVVQQRSTATTALSNAFGCSQMRPDQRKRGQRRLLRGVRDEEVAGSNPVTPTTVRPCQHRFRWSARVDHQGLSD